MSGRGLYVYGVAPADAGAELADDDAGSELRLIECGELVAVVSEVDLEEFDDEPLRARLADMRWVEQLARAHELVLDAMIERCTPIPMRLCTVYRDERGLKEMLEREHDVLGSGLRELRGKLEWGVKAFARGPDAQGGGQRSGVAAGTAGPGSGAAYLQSRLAERQAQERADGDLQQACEHVYSELGAVSVADRLGAIQRREVSGRDEPMILNALYLVENARRDGFLDRVAALREDVAEAGLTLEVTGPWPPYNFVPESVGGGL